MRRIEMIEEGQAHGRVREIYEEMEEDFGAPFVGAVFRSLAVQPDVLEAAWAQVRPNLETRAFVELAGRIRRGSDVLAEATFGPVDLYAWLRDHRFSREEIRRILYVLEAFHYLNPKLLLATAQVTAAVLGIKDPRITRRRAAAPRAEEPRFPTPIPQLMLEQAPDQVKEDYLDIMDVLGVPVVPDDFQALGNWPPFLRRVWSELKPVMRSTTLLEEAHNLSALAVESAQELPYPVELEDPGEDVRRIVETFLSLYSRISIGTAAVRWMVMAGERLSRTTGRAAGRIED